MLFACIHHNSLSQRDHILVETIKLQILRLINFRSINYILQQTGYNANIRANVRIKNTSDASSCVGKPFAVQT